MGRCVFLLTWRPVCARRTDRVIAPPITAVHGPVYSPKPEEALRMKLILRSKVWDMCYRVRTRDPDPFFWQLAPD
jgi:hypothetical protein